MILSLISLFKSMYFFTGSYSINVFPEPLSSEDEEMYLSRLKNGDKEARNTLPLKSGIQNLSFLSTSVLPYWFCYIDFWPYLNLSFINACVACVMFISPTLKPQLVIQELLEK